MVTAQTPQEDPMRKLFASLSATAIIAAGAVAAAQTSATAGTAMPFPDPGGAGPAATASSRGNSPDISFTTKMTSYTAINETPAGLSPGDGYVLAGQITRNGTADGLSTAQCTYTVTKGPVLRICTVDYVLANGLIVTSGYIHGPGKDAPVTLVVDGGTGAFANARGYGHLQPTSTGSNVTLHLTG
jgi:hypothetical protein